MLGTDDICGICFDDLDNGDTLDYCKYSCGKPIHLECFEMYCEKKGKKCINCNSSWEKIITETYINLGI